MALKQLYVIAENFEEYDSYIKRIGIKRHRARFICRKEHLLSLGKDRVQFVLLDGWLKNPIANNQRFREKLAEFGYVKA